MDRDDDDLRRLSSRLLHDAQVFFHVGRTLVGWQLGLAPETSWEVRTALIESFALHARGLRDFFYQRRRGRHQDDAFAFDFFDHNVWINKFAPPEGLWIRRIKLADPQRPVDRFGKEIGHLTFEPDDAPLSDLAAGWPVMQLASEIGAPLHAFVEEVEQAKVTIDFKENALREIPLVARVDIAQAGPGVWTRPFVTRRREQR